MKTKLLLLLAALTIALAVGACSSHADVGTRHHHVGLGGSVG